jgi:hypothetical protein
VRFVQLINIAAEVCSLPRGQLDLTQELSNSTPLKSQNLETKDYENARPFESICRQRMGFSGSEPG